MTKDRVVPSLDSSKTPHHLSERGHARVNLEGLEKVERGPIVELWLHRPDVHHALNVPLITALDEALRTLPESCRIVLIRAKGASFCAGADLSWMRETPRSLGHDGAQLLGVLLQNLTSVRPIVVAVVQGRAIGGGIGLLAACDYVLGSDAATLRLSEGRLGLAPAIIAPFVLRRAGRPALRRLAWTGQAMDAAEALALGLFDALYPAGTEVNAVEALCRALLLTAPTSVRTIKTLLASGESLSLNEACALLRELRAGPEAQEGIRSFFAGEVPVWAQTP